MTTLDNSEYIGAHSGVLTAAQKLALLNMDNALSLPGHANMHAQPSSLYNEEIRLGVVPNASTTPSVIRKAAWPIRVWAIDFYCDSAAGSACTMDLHVDPAGGTTFASVMAAAVDVKTGAGTTQRSKPTAEGYIIPAGATYKLVCIATGAGAVVGAGATLWCQRG